MRDELSDEALAVLRRLVGIDTDASQQPRRSLSSFLAGLPFSDHHAERHLREVADRLTKLTGSAVVLTVPRERSGTSVTETCLALRSALVQIGAARAARVEAAERANRLEWLQLAASLDPERLRIAGYPAHIERFLGRAIERLSELFPTIECSVDVIDNRVRVDGVVGELSDRFDVGDIDFMLWPDRSTHESWTPVYKYSLRVIGRRAELDALRDEARNSVHVSKLVGKRLIVAPAGTSSRRRLRDALLEQGVDLEDDTTLLETAATPLAIRTRAVAGEGMAVISDEYSAVGHASDNFPVLRLGPLELDRDHPHDHVVTMGLLRQRQAVAPRHQAFDYVVDELRAMEDVHPRAAALD